MNGMPSPRRICRIGRHCQVLSLLALTAWMAACAARPAHAGGGPENLFLVVNSRSWASLTVANHFIHLRKVSAGNVLYLDWGSDVDVIDVGTFRDRILVPAL